MRKCQNEPEFLLSIKRIKKVGTPDSEIEKKALERLSITCKEELNKAKTSLRELKKFIMYA